LGLIKVKKIVNGFYIESCLKSCIILLIVGSWRKEILKEFYFSAWFYCIQVSFRFSIDCAFTNPGAPTIISVSTSLDAVVSAQGSVEGGTQIYIKGTNFDPIAANNRITVGPYPCNLVADGANENTLSCITTAATDPSYQSSLAITVTVQTVFVACNSNNCKYTYTTSVTPFID